MSQPNDDAAGLQRGLFVVWVGPCGSSWCPLGALAVLLVFRRVRGGALWVSVGCLGAPWGAPKGTPWVLRMVLGAGREAHIGRVPVCASHQGPRDPQGRLWGALGGPLVGPWSVWGVCGLPGGALCGAWVGPLEGPRVGSGLWVVLCPVLLGQQSIRGHPCSDNQLFVLFGGLYIL